MGAIYLSCGHTDTRKPLGFNLYIRDEVIDFYEGVTPAIRSGSYCSSCASELIMNYPHNVWTDYESAVKEVFIE